MTQKVALVTGGATGIGLAITREFRKAGYRVIIFSPDWEERAEIDEMDDVHPVIVDLADPEQIDRAFSELNTLTTTLDVLVNNAAVYERCSFDALDLTTWEHTLRVNLIAPFLCCRHFRAFVNGHRKGYVINILSDAYYLGPRHGAHYAASKGGLLSLTRSLARILADDGLNVFAIAPGIVDSRQSRPSAHKYDKIAETIPLGRIAQPEDIGPAVVALASGAFDYMTGEVVHLTGGRQMR